MANFPTLSVPYPDFPINEGREDSVLRSPFEGGYTQTRAAHTRIKRTWSVNYNLLSTVDKELIEDFFDTTVNGGADSFTWTSPIDDVAYTVRFAPGGFYSSYVSYNRWNVRISLEQV